MRCRATRWARCCAASCATGFSRGARTARPARIRAPDTTSRNDPREFRAPNPAGRALSGSEPEVEPDGDSGMAKKSLNGCLRHVCKLAAVQTARQLGDRELLVRFVAEKDEAAFAVLVERHGAMVLGVCRRMLGSAHDAEDACQASFLVLAQKAASIRKTTSLPSWLHGVAARVASHVKRASLRR